MAASSHFGLVVGLGNPGSKYARTRHNVGFEVLDRIAADGDLTWTQHSRWNSQVARSEGCLWLKPQTYMNLSGQAVQAIRSFYQIPPERILVVFDDFSLPLGSLRLRSAGSAGGQNGMKDIIRTLGTEGIPRLRLGIGSPAESPETGRAADRPDAIDHVLSPFRADEAELLEKSLARAVDAVHCARHHGLEEAMNRFNGSVCSAS